MQIPFEAQAKAGEPMPDGLSESEIAVYQSIACLAARYRLGRVSAEQSQREMAQIRKAYDHAQIVKRETKHMADFWSSLGAALMRYGTDRTLENADILWRSASGLELHHTEQQKKDKEEVENG